MEQYARRRANLADAVRSRVPARRLQLHWPEPCEPPLRRHPPVTTALLLIWDDVRARAEVAAFLQAHATSQGNGGDNVAKSSSTQSRAIETCGLPDAGLIMTSVDRCPSHHDATRPDCNRYQPRPDELRREARSAGALDHAGEMPANCWI